MSWLAPHANTENCYLTTVGRRTGRSHEVEIWFGVVDDTLYLITRCYRFSIWTGRLAANVDNSGTCCYHLLTMGYRLINRIKLSTI